MDRNSPHSVKSYVEDINNIETVIKEDCQKYLLCGFPISTMRMISILSESTWIPSEPPIIQVPVDLRLNSKTYIGNSSFQFNFTASGPSQFTVYISPRDGTKLISTSLAPSLPTEPHLWNGRPLYVINYVWGKRKTPLNFTLDCETLLNWSKPMLDIAIAGSYKHDKLNVKTFNFTRFLSQFPDWTDVTAWLGMYQSWIY